MVAISVVMPVYNTQEVFLREAIESILNQTFSDFEFIIIDDGSTTNVKEVISSYSDNRIKYIYQENTGIVGALNNGLNHATGKYIARMDSDDIALPNRFEKQISIMENDKSIGVCGACVEEFDENGNIVKQFAPFKECPQMIDILFMTIICHPTAMFRTSVVKKHDIKYDNEYIFAEDQDIWYKILKYSNAYVIQENLLRYRRHNQATSNINAQIGINNHNKIKVEIIRELYPNLNPTIENLDSLLKQIWNNNFGEVISEKKMTLVQKFFSVKNRDIRKIITILGIKFKFKSKKLIERKRWQELNDKLEQQNQRYNEVTADLNNKLDQQTQRYNEVIADLNNKLDQQTRQLNDIFKTTSIANSFLDNFFMKKHLEKISTQLKFDKNALISYSYNNGESDEDYYYEHKLAGNIGDYVQSCAAKQFFPFIDEYIDRDLLSFYSGENVNLIMNAWWYLWKKNEKFSDKINPLFVAFHINNTQNVKYDTLKYLKLHEPIGCRDYATRDFLLQNGIEAYFSGCLTLTLGNTFKVNDSERENQIYFVDYFKGNNNDIDNEISRILESYTDCNIEHISHVRDIEYSTKENLEYAQSLIKKYAKAKLVITTRLHCALPCLSLGTPVIFVIPTYDKTRYQGLEELLNIIGADKYNNPITRIEMKDEYVVNNTNYQKYSDYLTKICQEFVNGEIK